jgi:hypothetical protein
VAERYGQGRVFLAGDAIHQLSPSGGQGMNTGIGDAVDLAWKLAATLGGWGGEGLLSTYDRERRPIGLRNVAMTTEFYLDHHKFGDGFAAIDEHGAAGSQLRKRSGEVLVREIGRMFRTTGLQLGYRYEDSPICLPDGTPTGPDDPEQYAPSARPGARAPHIWLRDGRSMLDLFGAGFVLLRFGPDAPDVSAVLEAAAARSVPVECIMVSKPDAAQLYGRKLVLVRPDGHVAWRSDELPRDPVAVIDTIRGAAVTRGIPIQVAEPACADGIG